MSLENKSSPWTPADKENWFREQVIQRSYADEVVSKIRSLPPSLDVSTYGTITVGGKDYPLYLVRSKSFDPNLKTVLITGGVHGYETSGVHGALAFLADAAPRFAATFNFVCAPCISPWAYETINRWNAKAIDPNRSFIPNSPAEECALFLQAMEPYRGKLHAHFDLHETTDTDNTVFRPALESRDGKSQPFSEIPDGFYTVGDSENPAPEFQRAIIDSVRKVTHIAAPDAAGKIIGEAVEQEGVIHFPVKSLSLCAGFSDAPCTTTTEVYPDSPRATPEICIAAQVAAITGGLEYLVRHASQTSEIEIVPYESKYQSAFRELNTEWITTYFKMEKADHDALDDPQGYILDRGGFIFVALEKRNVVGVCALLRHDDGAHPFELAKMAVAKDARGKGVGYLLGRAVIEKARSLQAKRLYLESNTLLKPALALYRKLGFQDVAGLETPYKRCNVQMELELG